jgi:hypothetical protein
VFHQAPDFEEPYYGALGWGRVPETGPAARNFNQMPTTAHAGGWKSLRTISGLRRLMRRADG